MSTEILLAGCLNWFICIKTMQYVKVGQSLTNHSYFVLDKIGY